MIEQLVKGSRYLTDFRQNSDMPSLTETKKDAGVLETGGD